jgi:hypothetical protein
MKRVLIDVFSFLRYHVRFLDLWLLILIVVGAEMNFSITSRVVWNIHSILKIEQQQIESSSRNLDVVGRLIRVTRSLAETLPSDGRVPAADVKELNARLKALEDALGGSPEKAIVGLTIRNDLNNLQDRYKSDIAAMRDEIKMSTDFSKRYEELLRWIGGFAITAIVGLFVLRYFPPKSIGREK